MDVLETVSYYYNRIILVPIYSSVGFAAFVADVADFVLHLIIVLLITIFNADSRPNMRSEYSIAIHRSIKNKGDVAFRCLLLVIRGLYVLAADAADDDAAGSDVDVADVAVVCVAVDVNITVGGTVDWFLEDDDCGGVEHQRLSLSNICNDRVTRSSFRQASKNSSIVMTPSWFKSSFRNTRSTYSCSYLCSFRLFF